MKEGIRNDGRLDGKAEDVMALMENFDLLVTAAMDGLKIPAKDRADILSRIKELS